MTAERGPFFSNPFVARAARWGLLAWSAIGIIILAYVVYRWALFPIRAILAPLLVALVVVYLLNPTVTWLEERRVRRWIGALAVYIVFLAAVGVGLAYLIPVLTHQASEFVKGVPDLLARGQRGLQSLASRLGVSINGGDLVKAFEQGGGASRFVSRVTSLTSGAVRVALVAALGPLIAFYVLVDLPKIAREATSLVPAGRRDEALTLGARVSQTLGSFFRGQLVVAFLLGNAAALGFWIVGFPYFALFGVLVGILALVPLIGVLLAAVPTLFVAFATSSSTGGVLHIRGGWPLALACAIVLTLVELLDTRLLTPRLHRPTVRLHPVTVLISLLVGGALFGFWGLFFAVPAVAAAKVVALHVWDTRSQWPPRVAPVPDTEPHRHAAGDTG
ncbi:MAG TPA: AI-2E family transporter [Actinomycetota bacterium]|jgi:predicted PurR-regulated permease PerM